MDRVMFKGSHRVMETVGDRLRKEGVKWGFRGGTNTIVAYMSRREALGLIREKMGYRPSSVAID